MVIFVQTPVSTATLLFLYDTDVLLKNYQITIVRVYSHVYNGKYIVIFYGREKLKMI